MLYTKYSDVDKILECGPKIVNTKTLALYEAFQYVMEDSFYMDPCAEYPGFVKVRDYRNRLLLPKVKLDIGMCLNIQKFTRSCSMAVFSG